MTFLQILILLITAVGVLFSLFSAIGILRLPDVYTRMHALGKGATLGISCIMLAAGLYYPEYLNRMIFLVVLFFVTGPIASTTMARAAYRISKPHEKFVLHLDEMAEKSSR